jgi:hypothetical protein
MVRVGCLLIVVNACNMLTPSPPNKPPHLSIFAPGGGAATIPVRPKGRPTCRVLRRGAIDFAATSVHHHVSPTSW